MSDIDFSKLTSAAELLKAKGREAKLLRSMLEEAKQFMLSFGWCHRIENIYLGLGVGRVVAVFLCEITPALDGIDRVLWVIVGDLPPAYLVTDDTPNPACALAAYIEEMSKWVAAVREGRSVKGLMPVNVEPSPELAQDLERRLELLTRDILLARHRQELSECECGREIVEREGRA